MWIAGNDRSRPYVGGRLADGYLTVLPAEVTGGPAADSVSLIDVPWPGRANGRVGAAFEVERCASIYSGIVRMLDLSPGPGDIASSGAARDRHGDAQREVAMV